MLRQIYARLRALWRWRRQEAELDDEIRFHLSEEMDDRVAGGMSPEHGRVAAIRDFGNVPLIREQTRETWGWGPAERLLQDARYAARIMRRKPGFTCTVVLTLALCIGANAAIFSVLDAGILRPLSFTEPDRIVGLPGLSTDGLGEWRTRTKTLSALALHRPRELTLAGRDEALALSGMEVSEQFFDVFGSPAMLGRTVLAPDARVIVLSHGTWTRYLGADAGVIDKFIRLDDVQYQVIGVMPDEFAFPSRDTAFWIPLQSPAAGGPFDGVHTVSSAVGRLAEGVSLEQAAAEAEVIGEALGSVSDERQWKMSTLLAQTTADVRPVVLMVQAAGVLLLLIACVNVSGVLLARAIERKREFAVRIAIGAGRWRLTRQVLAEGLCISGLGAVLGYVLSLVGITALLPLVQDAIPHLDTISPDPVVFAAVGGVSLICGVLCSLVPALSICGPGRLGALKIGGLSETGDRHGTATRGILVMAQVALAVVVLVAAGLLVTSYRHLTAVDPGYDPAGVLSFDVSLPADRYPLIEQRRLFFSELLRETAAMPDVESVGLTSAPPFRFAVLFSPLVIDGISYRWPDASFKIVSPDYFGTMTIPVVRGRGFTDLDGAAGPYVVAVSERFARERFSNTEPIGRQIEFMRRTWEVAGVVEDVNHTGLDQEPWSEIFLSYRQLPSDNRRPWLTSMTFAIKSEAAPAGIIPEVRRRLFHLDPTVALNNVAAMDELVLTSIARPRFQAVVIGTFAVGALLLCALGVSSVVAHTVRNRTREIGIRMALGAGPAAVLALVLRRSLALTSIGIVLGVLAAFAGASYLESMLFGVSPLDQAVLVGAVLLLSTVAAVASYLPARRATAVNPVTALRWE